MARDCIICGGPTGSREHIFPAALGGRRTNKGIYCGSHNEGFSPLASVLAEQLRAINALLSVRPDHGDAPTSVVLDGGDGNKFELSGTTIKPVPATSTEPIGDGEVREMAFASEADAQRWLAAQRAAGHDVRLIAKEKRTQYLTEALHIRLTLGGPEGLRAIGYVGLTYFAHHFPELARTEGLRLFKEYVQGKTGAPLVWWETEEESGQAPANPFPFGHTIELCVSANTRCAFARVSLFSALTFAMELGEVDAGSDATVVTHIDPHADHPPDDIVVTKHNARLLDVKKPADLTSRLSEIISKGIGERRLGQLVGRIRQWQLERDLLPLFDQVCASRTMSEGERREVIREVVGAQRQRVLNLMRYVSNELGSKKSGKPTDAFLAAFEALVAPDTTSPSCLSKVGECALEIAAEALSEEIARRLDDLTFEQWLMLFGGGPGAAVVGDAMTKIILGDAAPVGAEAAR